MDEDSLLVNYLWASRFNPVIRKRSIRSRFLVPAIYLGAGALMWNSRADLSWILLGFGLVWILFYPIYENYAYKRHYRKLIKQNFGHRNYLNFEIGIQDEKLFFSDGENESLVPAAELDSVWEHSVAGILIRLKTGHTFYLPEDNSLEFLTFSAELKDWFKLNSVDVATFAESVPGIKKS
jgi:hypothetical protein